MKTLRKIALLAIFALLYGKSNVIHAQSDSKKYDMVISFISTGSGIDAASFEKVSNYLNGNSKLKMEKLNWGREGEVDFYLDFDGLKRKEKKSIRKELIKLTENKELIQVSYDKSKRKG